MDVPMVNRNPIRAMVFVVGIGAAAWLAWSAADADTAPTMPESLPATVLTSTPSPPTAKAVSAAALPTDPVREAAAVPPQANVPPANARSLRTVVGRVQLPSGQPVANVTVAIGARRTKTPLDGTFRLEFTNDQDALVATGRGHEPAVLDAVGTRPEVIEGRELVVTLPGPAATITGWLVDTDGNSCTGWHVDLHSGGTDCGDDGLPKLMAEDLAAGADDLPADWRQHAAATTSPNDQKVGGDGSFLIGGLRTGRDYVLRARNERTLQTVRSEPIRAGTQGLRFVVPAGTWREQVTGRAIDRNGGAIPGVRVRLTMRVHRNGYRESYETGQEVRTGPDGGFAFSHVPCEDLLLRFDQADIESLYYELPGTHPGQDVVVNLSSQCRFRCEPAANLPATATLRVLDVLDRPLQVLLRSPNADAIGGQRLAVPPEGGEFAVSDQACWLVFEVDERVVRRLPIRLRRGEVTVVRG
jgi:hypothetical protein